MGERGLLAPALLVARPALTGFVPQLLPSSDCRWVPVLVNPPLLRRAVRAHGGMEVVARAPGTHLLGADCVEVTLPYRILDEGEIEQSEVIVAQSNDLIFRASSR